MWVRSLRWDNPLEEQMETHSSILAWEIPRTEEHGRLQSMGSQRVGHNLVTKQQQEQLKTYQNISLKILLIGIFGKSSPWPRAFAWLCCCVSLPVYSVNYRLFVGGKLGLPPFSDHHAQHLGVLETFRNEWICYACDQFPRINQPYPLTSCKTSYFLMCQCLDFKLGLRGKRPAHHGQLIYLAHNSQLSVIALGKPTALGQWYQPPE